MNVFVCVCVCVKLVSKTIKHQNRLKLLSDQL